MLLEVDQLKVFPMFTGIRIAAVIVSIAAPIAGFAGNANDAPDIILTNGQVFTGVTAKPRVEALAIRGERILAVGTTADINQLATAKTQRIDLHGATVIPGINDAHNHLDISPSDAVELAIKSHDPSWIDVRALLSEAVKHAPPGTILAGVVGPSAFHDPALTRAALDQVAPSNPVLLVTFTGHAGFLNSAALSRFGITEAQQDPLGGKYERDKAGKLTGVLREYALMQLERDMADKVPDAEATAQLKAQLERAATLGITSLQDMSNIATPERAARVMAQIPAPIRVRIIQMAATTPAGRVLNDGKPVEKNPAPNLTVSGIKWLLDGVPIENTFTSRFAPAPRDGADLENSFRNLPLTFPATEITAMLKEATAAHQQLMVHVSGSVSASAMLQALESSGGAQTWAGRRVRFEHGDGLTADLIPRVKALGVVVVQNPSHLTALKDTFGTTFTVMQPLKSLLDAGIPVGLGSDGPVNPYLNILFASLHSNRPAEAITREQAVIAYTQGSAYAEFAEQDKGTLEPGKLADLAVLSQDIFKVPPPELPKTVSVLTMVGGKIVHRKSAT
jgi:predicted amidohydrolase YtcJ